MSQFEAKDGSLFTQSHILSPTSNLGGSDETEQHQMWFKVAHQALSAAVSDQNVSGGNDSKQQGQC